MAKSLSLDIRERVVALVVEGLSCREVARRLRISAASAVRIMQRHRVQGSVAPYTRGRPRGGGKLDAVALFLRHEIEARPDITMPELAERLRAMHDVRAAPAELSRYLRYRLGMTYKKIPDRDGTQAPAGPRRPFRLAASPDAEDAPRAAQAGLHR
jgi:transposase